MTEPVLAIWSWGSAAMLGWSAAILIPLAIHFWSRRRYREYSFAAMQFLLAAMKKHSRRVQLEQLLLLLTRVLLLVLLACALANPLWTWSTEDDSSDGPTHRFLVIDTSYSMGYREGDQSSLQKGQDRLRQWVQASRPADGFTLLRMESSPRILGADVLFDRGEVLQQIDNLHPGPTRADLPAALTTVERHLEHVRERYRQFVHYKVYVVSDLARNTWSDATTTSVRELVERISESATVSVHDVGGPNRGNLAVVSLGSSRASCLPGDRVTITAEIQAFQLPANVSPQLEILHDGRVVHSEMIRLAEGNRQTVSFEFQAAAVGDQVFTARLSADQLPVDNERWLVVPVKPSWKVLCVGGEADAARFVALALSPNSDDSTSIQPVVSDETALLEENLSDFAGIFLCNVGRFTEQEARALRQYVQRGGGLVVSLGDQVQEDHYNRLLVNEVGLLPARLGAIQRGEWLFDPLEYRHPISAPFRGRERAGLLTVPTWRYLQLTPASTSTVTLGLTSGDPAVVEMSLGNGRVILVATALSTSSTDRTVEPAVPWNALPAWPSFPPLVHGLLKGATAGTESSRHALAGQSLTIELPTAIQQVTVVLPDQQRRTLSTQAAAGGSRAVLADTGQVGIYGIETAGEDAPRQQYAVNLDSRESDLERIDAASLPDSLQGLSAVGDLDGAVPTQGSVEFFRPLLVLVGFLLLVEQTLAGALSRRGM